MKTILRFCKLKNKTVEVAKNCSRCKVIDQCQNPPVKVPPPAFKIVVK